MNTFTNLEAFLAAKLNSIIVTYTASFASKIEMLIQGGAVILVLYYGYSILSGRGSNATIPEMLWNMGKIAIVLTFVQNANNMLDLSIAFINELKTDFVGAKSIFSLLDQQLAAVKQLTVTLMEMDDSLGSINGRIASLMVWIGEITVIATAAIIFISSEVGLTLLTAVAPIFIGCLTYSFLQEMFNGWLRSIFSCIITLIFASLVVRIGIDINHQVVEQLSSATAHNGVVATGGIVLTTSIIISALILISKNMAGSIAGVAASAAIQGGMTAAAAGAARFGGVAGMAGGRATVRGGQNLKSNISASVANRAKLAESVQKAAAERVKQNNLKE